MGYLASAFERVRVFGDCAVCGCSAPAYTRSLPFSLAGGVGVGLFGVWWETALAERIPAHLLSRVSAYDWMGSLALVPLGYVLSGVVG